MDLAKEVVKQGVPRDEIVKQLGEPHKITAKQIELQKKSEEFTKKHQRNYVAPKYKEAKVCPTRKQAIQFSRGMAIHLNRCTS
ncbi:MAG: hypothetical protein AB8B55_01875 [Mariniblastus sp.]